MTSIHEALTRDEISEQGEEKGFYRRLLVINEIVLELTSEESAEQPATSHFFIREVKHKNGVVTVARTDSTRAPSNLAIVNNLYTPFKDKHHGSETKFTWDLLDPQDVSRQRVVRESFTPGGRTSDTETGFNDADIAEIESCLEAIAADEESDGQT